VDLKQVQYVGVNWIQLAQESRVASSCENGTERSGSIKCTEFHDQQFLLQ
jgi:hypothetical protein